MSGALHSQCFSSDVTVFNDANTTENNPNLGEYHACSADKGDADCPGPPGAYICRFGWVYGTPKSVSLLLGQCSLLQRAVKNCENEFQIHARSRMSSLSRWQAQPLARRVQLRHLSLGHHQCVGLFRMCSGGWSCPPATYGHLLGSLKESVAPRVCPLFLHC